MKILPGYEIHAHLRVPLVYPEPTRDLVWPVTDLHMVLEWFCHINSVMARTNQLPTLQVLWGS